MTIKDNASVVLLGVVGLSLFILSMLPFSMSGAFHDSQRLISMVLVLLGLSVTLWQVTLSTLQQGFLAIVAIAGLWIVSSSPNPEWSLVEFSLLFSVLLLSFTLWASSPTQQQWEILAYVFVAIQGFYIVRNLTYYFATLWTGAELDVFGLIDGFSNVRFYGQFLIWTIPFVLGVLAVQKVFAYRILILLILMLGCTFEFLTGTRAFWLALSVSVPMVWWFCARSMALSYLRVMFQVVLGGFLFYLLFLFVLPEWFGVDVASALDRSLERDLLSSSGRSTLWLTALQAMQSEPWLGIGPMLLASVEWSEFSAHPHNYLLQFLAEWGIPFTVFIVATVIWSVVYLRGLVQKDSVARAPLILPVIASLSAASAAGLVDGLLVMPVSLVYLVILLSLAMALWRSWTPDTKRQRLPLWAVTLGLLCCAGLTLFTGLSFPGHQDEVISKTNYGIEDGRNPRFWTRGKLSHR